MHPLAGTGLAATAEHAVGPEAGWPRPKADAGSRPVYQMGLVKLATMALFWAYDLNASTANSPDPGADPDSTLNSGPIVAVPGRNPASPDPRPVLSDTTGELPGTTGEPDDISTCYAHPRRRRRRRLAVAAAVLTATAWAGLLIAPASHAVPRPPGPAYALSAGSREPGHGRTELPGPGAVSTGLVGINVFGWGCTANVAGIAPDSSHAWVICRDGLMFELDAATGAPNRVLTGSRCGLGAPSAVASDGRHMWVTNDPSSGSGSVIELDAVTGAPVRVLSGSRCGFDGPAAIAVGGARVWVANTEGNSVTELNAVTGAPVRVRTRLNWPVAVAVDGARVWVVDGGWLTELNAATGALIRVLTERGYGFDGPIAVASDGRLWVANDLSSGGGSVTELNAATGALVVNGSAYGFSAPGAIASDGRHVWVSNDPRGGDGSTTELGAVTGAVVRVLTGSRYRFNAPVAVAADAARVWVANFSSDSVTEFPASSQ